MVGDESLIQAGACVVCEDRACVVVLGDGRGVCARCALELLTPIGPRMPPIGPLSGPLRRTDRVLPGCPVGFDRGTVSGAWDHEMKESSETKMTTEHNPNIQTQNRRAPCQSCGDSHSPVRIGVLDLCGPCALLRHLSIQPVGRLQDHSPADSLQPSNI